MAKLSAAARKKIPTGEFALPGRRYPIEDKAHAANAKARAAQFATPAEKKIIDAKANRVLHGGMRHSGMSEHSHKGNSGRKSGNMRHGGE